MKKTNKKAEVWTWTSIWIWSIITWSLLSYLFPIIPAILWWTASYLFSLKTKKKKFNFWEYWIFLFFSYIAWIIAYLFFIDNYTSWLISDSKLWMYVLISCMGWEYVISYVINKFKNNKLLDKINKW